LALALASSLRRLASSNAPSAEVTVGLGG
jgi:hypothetical protein